MNENDISISLAISHTPWVPERALSMSRLRTALELEPGKSPGYLEMTDRAPNWSWSESMWRWASEEPVSHACFLQDDVIPFPDFFSALGAMTIAHPDSIIGLESVHPGAKDLARAGQHGYTTSDGLIGVGYVLPVPLVKELLSFRLQRVKKPGLEHITEDALVNVFAMATGRHIWHPCPTIIKHDTSIASTYGNDWHSHREPSVTWTDAKLCGFTQGDLKSPSFWSQKPAHLGRFYGGTVELCRKWVRGFDEVAYRNAMNDVGPSTMNKWVNPWNEAA